MQPRVQVMTKIVIYGRDLIVQNNRLIEAVQDLTLSEKRLMLFLSPIVRRETENDPKKNTFTVRACEFAEEYGLKLDGVYGHLEYAADSLQTKMFQYWQADQKSRVKVNFAYRSTYRDGLGEVDITLPEEVVFLLTVFDKHNQFTKYDKKNIAKMTSVHAITLYELLVQYRNLGERTLELSYLRERFGCTKSYETMYDFKRYVIDVAIKQIQENTGLKVSYHQNKKGRLIHSLTFKFSEKDSAVLKARSQRDADTPDLFTGLTDKQIALFAGQLARLPELAHYAPVGGSYEDFAKIIRHQLQDPAHQQIYMPYLKDLGFKSS